MNFLCNILAARFSPHAALKLFLGPAIINWEVAELTAASIPVPRAAPGGKKSFTLPPVVYCEAVKMPDGAALGPIGILLFASTSYRS